MGAFPSSTSPAFPAHLEIEWDRRSSREFLERLAEGAKLVRYDLRGAGLSDRDVHDVSIGAHVRDLEAVVAASGFEQFALLGLGMLAGPVAITYAARSDRVTRVVLSSAFADGSRLSSPANQASLIDYTERMGFPVLEYSERTDPEASLTARAATSCISPPRRPCRPRCSAPSTAPTLRICSAV